MSMYFMMTSSGGALCRLCVLIILATFHPTTSASTPAASPCASYPCENGGSCLAFSSAFLCRCTNEYTGLRCETLVSRTDTACDPNPCVHGACVSSASDRFTCMCPPGWRGTTCENDINECREQGSSSICLNDTACINEDGGYRCEDTCSPSQCQHGGICSTKDSSPYFQCECPPNYEGDLCDILVETDDACRSVDNMCQNGGQCFSFGGAAICHCQPGYQGQHCEIDTDPCIKDPCRNGGTCANNQSAPNGFTCSCASDFQGDVCEETIEPCTTDPCMNGATCVNNQTAPLGFQCACGSDFRGPLCEEMIPPCLREPCKNGGTCISEGVAQNGFDCVCDHGYQGPTCEVSIPTVSTIISPCDSNPCQNNGKCGSAEGALTEFHCICLEGYQGSLCEQIQPNCTHLDAIYTEGTTRKDDCNTCDCQGGEWSCTKKFCGEYIVSFAFNQDNAFGDDEDFTSALKDDIAEHFDIHEDMIQVITISGNPSEVQFKLQDTLDSDVDIENVAADMLRQFKTGIYAFQHNQASYSINTDTVIIERSHSEVTDHGDSGDEQKFISTALIIVCVVVSSILLVAVIFGVSMIVVYKRRSRKENICNRKEKNANTSNNGAGGEPVYHSVISRDPYGGVPPEVAEIRLQNGAKPENFDMEARV